MLFDGLAVGFCGVAFVDVPGILWVEVVKPFHLVISICFGKDGCCRYVGEFAVAFYYCCPGYVTPWLEAVAVDDYGSGGDFEGVEGAVHGQYGGVEDVDAVDLFGCHDSYGPCDGFGLDVVAEQVAVVFAKLF